MIDDYDRKLTECNEDHIGLENCGAEDSTGENTTDVDSPTNAEYLWNFMGRFHIRRKNVICLHLADKRQTSVEKTN